MKDRHPFSVLAATELSNGVRIGSGDVKRKSKGWRGGERKHNPSSRLWVKQSEETRKK